MINLEYYPKVCATKHKIATHSEKNALLYLVMLKNPAAKFNLLH